MDPEPADEVLGTGGSRALSVPALCSIEDHADDVGVHIAQSLDGFS
jgi:hypothetical protein